MQTDVKFIIDGLANIYMRPSENMRDYFSSLTQIIDAINKNYNSYRNAPEQPQMDI